MAHTTLQYLLTKITVQTRLANWLNFFENSSNCEGVGKGKEKYLSCKGGKKRDKN